jgi:hypothetical protein
VFVGDGAMFANRSPSLVPSPPATAAARPLRLTTSYDERHPYLMGGIRLAVGVWLFVLFTFLLSAGDWWGVVLLLPAAILFVVGTRVLQNFRTSRSGGESR